MSISKIKQSDRYIYVKLKDHPNAKGGWYPEHRLVAEQFLGRYLKPEEVIHHIDLIKDNNNILNLMLFANNKEHMKWHTQLRRYGYLTKPMKRRQDSNELR